MKKFIFMILLGITTLLAESGVQLYTNFEIAKAEALKQNKPMMIMFQTKGCPECGYMKKVVFNDQKAVQYMNENFINVSLDIHKDDIPTQYDYFGIPTFFITDKNGNQVHRHIGGSRTDPFIQMLQEAKTKIKG